MMLSSFPTRFIEQRRDEMMLMIVRAPCYEMLPHRKDSFYELLSLNRPHMPFQACSVNNNKVKRFPKNGIVAEDSTGTLYDSTISGNDVEDNGQDGILIEAGSDSYDNVLFGNKTEGNHTNDCEDDTIGSGLTLIGSLGTANTWFNNIGSSSNPTGLCTPGR